jgi:branched-chain amino acid transport system ATP-binding protein
MVELALLSIRSLSGGFVDSRNGALEVENVAVHYGKFVAVASASFVVSPGEFVAIIGPNGHGKSSLVNSLAGLVQRTGEVRIDGQRLASRNPKAAVTAGLVLVPERRHLYPGLSVRDNILLGSYVRTRRFLAERAWEDVADVLDVFPELTSLVNQRAGTLSGGQQQMVALARAMAAKPAIIMLDEPCLGLAEAVSKRVYEWLAMMAKSNMTILLVEENPVHALQAADRALEMYKGVMSVPDTSAFTTGSPAS